MLSSKIRYLTNLFLSRAKPTYKSYSLKRALMVTTSFLIPGCVYAVSHQNMSTTQKQIKSGSEQNVQNETQKVEKNEQKAKNLQQADKKSQQEGKDQNQNQLEDTIINYIKQYEDAKKLNLRGHTLIWYQSLGVKQIDDQVVALLHHFVQKNQDNISCPFKIIIDTTKRSKQTNLSSDYYKKQVELVIVKPQDIKPISLNKFLSFQGTKDLKYDSLFQRLIKQVNDFNEVNWSNIRKFAHDLGNRPYEAYVVMSAPKDLIKLRKARKKFNSFIENKQVFGAHTTKAMVTDEHSMRYLGLPHFQPGEDNIYVILPDSQNIIKQGRTVYIDKHKYHIFAPWELNNSVVFPPYLQKSNPDSLTLKVSVDLNQNIANEMAKIYQSLSNSSQFPALSSIPKYLYFGPAVQSNGKSIQISLQKNNFNQIVNAYSPQCRYSNREKRNLIYGGHRWKYNDDEVTKQGLQEWINSVQKHEVQPTYQSQIQKQSKIKVYNSKRINGQEYSELLNKNKNKPKVIFHFSEHCFSCKKFKHFYEEVAGEKKDQYDFYRIDNDHNKSKELQNFNSTPVFVIYKNGHKYIYKNTIFTKSLFESFLQITGKVKQMDLEVLEKNVEDRRQNQFKISDLN